VAIHQGLIRPLLGGGRWKDVAADAMIALIAVKLILLALHARLERSRLHRVTHPDSPSRAEPEWTIPTSLRLSVVAGFLPSLARADLAALQAATT
jgi:hypothetical protein